MSIFSFMSKPDEDRNEKLSLIVQELKAQREDKKAAFEWYKSHLNAATKQDLELALLKIMSAISDFAAKQAAFNTRQGAAIDTAVAGVQGLTDDVAALNKKIQELQNSVGGVTPEDQALLDQLEVAGNETATRLEAVATALAALDAQTPPTPPVG